MKDQAAIEQVLDAIHTEDPDGDDAELEAMRNALRFVLGYEGTVAEFIAMYVKSI